MHLSFMDSELKIKTFSFTEFPKRKLWAVVVKFVKTGEVLLFKIFEKLDLYRPVRTIFTVPGLATSHLMILQAAIYNGTYEEVLGFRPRRLLRRLVKGIPDLESFEKIKFELRFEDKAVTHVASTETRGFMQEQVAPPYFMNQTVNAWLKVKPLGVETVFGTIKLGSYEIFSQPVFFLNRSVKWIIISDIDDTIKDSQISKTTDWKHILKCLFKGHYYEYAPIKGMAELYQDLVEKNAMIVYLTSTPFQLTPFLLKFLKDNHFPLGPVFPRWLGYGKFSHKWRVIKKILAGTKDQPILFIGDSGELDLDIYRRAFQAADTSQKVSKILIRHLPGTKKMSLQPHESYYHSMEDLRAQLHSLGVFTASI